MDTLQLPPDSLSDDGLSEREVIERVRRPLVELSSKNTATIDDIMRRITVFAAEFRAQVPDWRKYRLYHELVGGTVPPDVDKLDSDAKPILSFVTRELESRIAESP